MLYGEAVLVLEERDGVAFVQAQKDGYVGYLPSAALRADAAPTHAICAPSSHAYENADFKSRDLCALSHGSRLRVTATNGRFGETELGYVPLQHLAPVTDDASDPVRVAEQFLGTPYLWGGNSRWGIDCSGLVQAAMLAAGHPCPGDSDMQEAEFGTAQPEGTPYQRCDLLFWKGHVALVTSPDTLIHANAFHMAVAYEGIEAAVARIADQGDGPVTAHKRV